MKRLNKKGFTLIELLAVIIILGVLMIIAIPAVTKYINDSRKSAFVDSGVHFVDAVSKEAIAGKDLKMYSQSTLYLVAVGHEKEKSCISLESGGKSPYSDSWAYAYVGVTYSNNGYTYYFVAKDGSGKKMPFTANKVLVDSGVEEFDKAITPALDTALENAYLSTSSTVVSTVLAESDHKQLVDTITTAEPGKTIDKIVIINKKADNCTYADNG